MRKVDVVLVVLGVAAAVATTVGVAKSGDWTDERTYGFEELSIPLAAQGPTPAGSAPARFEWAAPANATGADLLVTIDFTAQPIQGGDAIVRIAGVAPDGTNLPPMTATFAATASGSEELRYNASWHEVPGDVRDRQDPDGIVWDKPLVITVTVDRPADLPGTSYAFTAKVSGSFATYRAT